MDETAPLEITSTATPARVSDRIRTIVLGGLVIVGLFFGTFGVWAALSPLDGAVVGEGVVTVEGNRKSIEHLDGGIVRQILVKDGDHVSVGDTLVLLDDERLKSQLDILTQQLVVARATKARLEAELDSADAIAFPDDLARSPEDYVVRALAMQSDAFSARLVALKGNQQVLQHRIDDLNEQIAGRQAHGKASQDQLASITAEADSLRPLVDSGLTTRAHLLDLDRSADALRAEISDNQAAIASAEQNIAENQQQIVQLMNDRRAQVASDLGDTESKLLDLGPSVANAQAVLARTIVRSPYSGKVVGLKVFSTGAVVAPGGTILDIVPDGTDLIVEAKIRVEDISDVHPGSDAEIHFTTYKKLYVPTLRATINTVSADRLTDERSGIAYYLAQLVVDPSDLARNGQISLYPGMPAQVMVITKKRTALEYLVGPMFAAFDGAFRQN